MTPEEEARYVDRILNATTSDNTAQQGHRDTRESGDAVIVSPAEDNATVQHGPLAGPVNTEAYQAA